MSEIDRRTSDGRTNDGVRSADLVDGAKAILGERFAELRIDPDRSPRVTVIDLDGDDVAAIEELRKRLDIRSLVHVERAEPEALALWESLRLDLIRLQAARPRLLREYPMPERGYQRPPVHIGLSTEAIAEAAELYARYGSFVSLRVGSLPYPPRAGRPAPAGPMPKRATADRTEMQIELDGPLSIRSGQRAMHALLLTNHSQQALTVHTNGDLTASTHDPATGRTVGGYSGPHRAPLVRFTATAEQTVRIPLLVDTASSDPSLGYAIPAGRWHLTAPLDLSDRRRLVTPPLDLTVTD